MQKVTGIGGVFIKSANPKALSAWYEQHLGIALGEHAYISFQWVNPHHPTEPGQTVFSFMKESSDYFAPSEKPFMLNFRVHDVHGLIDALKKEGVWVADKIQEYEYGKFGWCMDPEGNKIELWEPVDG